MKMPEIKLDKSYTNEVITLTFHGVTEEGKINKDVIINTLNFTVADLPENIIKTAICHGLVQKLGDSLAMTKEMREATSVSESVESIQALWEQLKGGDWNAKAKTTKQPSITHKAMHDMLYDAVRTGSMSYEAANMIYKKVSGEDLNKPEDAE